MPKGLPCPSRLRYAHILILVDVNLPKVNSSEYTYIGCNNSTEAQFFNFTENLGLFGNVKSETHWRISETPPNLDCVFANEEFSIDNLSTLALLGKSDHLVIPFSFIIKTEVKHLTNDRRWNFRRLGLSSLQSNIQQMDWKAHPQLDVDAR